MRGFIEQGTTTTPFGMVVLNGISRYQLAALALKYARPEMARRQERMEWCERKVREIVEYTRVQLEDPPEIRDWRWGS